MPISKETVMNKIRTIDFAKAHKTPDGAPLGKEGIAEAKKNMEKAVKELDFLNAAHYRDLMVALQEKENKWNER